MLTKKAKFAVISTVIVGLVLFFGLPLLVRLAGPPTMGRGSYKHARLWKDKLAACNSLDDVRKRFNCGSWRAYDKGSGTYIKDPNTFREGNTWALLYDLPNGDWLAMAYASSHGHRGGGTVVIRDSTGRIRVYFGHVCGRPFAVGESLDEIYASFQNDRLGNWKEVSLSK